MAVTPAIAVSMIKQSLNTFAKREDEGGVTVVEREMFTWCPFMSLETFSEMSSRYIHRVISMVIGYRIFYRKIGIFSVKE
jgi:hypothetical protein